MPLVRSIKTAVIKKTVTSTGAGLQFRSPGVNRRFAEDIVEKVYGLLNKKYKTKNLTIRHIEKMNILL